MGSGKQREGVTDQGAWVTVDARMTDIAGIGRVLRQLLDQLLQRMPELRFCLLGDVETLRQYASERVEVRQCMPKLYSLREQWELWRAIPPQTELFWAPHYVIPLAYRGKLLVTVHDVMHLALPVYREAWHKRLYADIMFRAVAEKADAVVVVSEFTRTELPKYTRIKGDRVTVIPNAVDAGWFVQGEGERGRRLDTPYVLYVGSIKPHKNLVRAMQAFARLPQAWPHRLVLVGMHEGLLGADAEAIRLAGELGERVVMTGKVSDAALRCYMAHAEAVFMPSYYEGFGLPPLEAMACGAPVISSNAASLPEVCADAAFYCDPWDVESMRHALATVLQDANLRQQLRMKGYEQVQRFSWERAAEDYARVIRDMLGSPPSA